MNVNDTMYINPYTFQATSKRVTGTENRREIAELLRDETMFRVVSPEELMGGIGKPLNLAGTTSVNRSGNSVNIAEGASITLPGGYVLTVNDYYVAVSGGDPYNQAAQREAAEMASALTMILRNAGGTANIVAFSSVEYQKWTENVSKVMRYIGIDTSKPFTVNGMRYTTNSKGYFESAASTAAQEAYERQIAANRTYEFADERTKNKIAYLTDYYLSAVPEDVKAAWQAALEETGINPFQSGYVSTLQQLSVEQDFLTGGNDNIFGDSLESSINALNSILDRIENPLGAVTAERREFLQQEKVFYQSLLSKLEKRAQAALNDIGSTPKQYIESGDIVVNICCDNVNGLLTTVYKTPDFDPQNPVYKVKTWGTDGNVTERMIDVSKIDTKNCDSYEMFTYISYLEDSGKGDYRETTSKFSLIWAVKNIGPDGLPRQCDYSEKVNWVEIVQDIMQL